MPKFNAVTLLLIAAAFIAGGFLLPFAWSAVNLALIATLVGLWLSRATFAGLSLAQIAKISGVALGLHLALATGAYYAARLARWLIIGGSGLVS